MTPNHILSLSSLSASTLAISPTNRSYYRLNHLIGLGKKNKHIFQNLNHTPLRKKLTPIAPLCLQNIGIAALQFPCYPKASISLQNNEGADKTICPVIFALSLSFNLSKETWRIPVLHFPLHDRFLTLGQKKTGSKCLLSSLLLINVCLPRGEKWTLAVKGLCEGIAKSDHATMAT